MFQLIIIQTFFFLLGALGTYLCWGPWVSNEMVQHYGPLVRISEEQSDPSMILEMRRKKGLFSEIIRLFALSFFSVIGLTFFVKNYDLSRVFSNYVYWAIVSLATIGAIFWCFYLGPRIFAYKHLGRVPKLYSSENFRIYVKPYIGWVLYSLSIWAGILIFDLAILLDNIFIDYTEMQNAILGLKQVSLGNLYSVQVASMRLVEFGIWSMTSSQKYIFGSILLTIYVVIEQNSAMHLTLNENSIEMQKAAAWIIFLFAIGFSLFVLPSIYAEWHIFLRSTLVDSSTWSNNPDAVSEVLNLQQFLNSHDARWVLLGTISGYGNILTTAIISSILLLWRAYFQDIPVSRLFNLFLPRKFISMLERFVQGLSVETNQGS